jgi:acetyltransferase-like isoleucine patch superfamily enzyme
MSNGRRILAELKHQLRWALPLRAVQLATAWFPDNSVAVRVRGALARPFIARCGRGFQLGRDVTLLNTYALEIGDEVYIAKGSWLNAMGGLQLEDEVVIAPYVVISTLQHVFKDGSVRFGGSIARSVRIGRGTWIAAHASVKCGVSVGTGVLVAANSCVVNDIEANTVVGGVPARTIGPNRDGEPELFSRFVTAGSHHERGD